jgi:hypothetical protein
VTLRPPVRDDGCTTIGALVTPPSVPRPEACGESQRVDLRARFLDFLDRPFARARVAYEQLLVRRGELRTKIADRTTTWHPAEQDGAASNHVPHRPGDTVIPANQLYDARYKHENSGHVHYTTKRVVAWDEDGHPLVIGGDSYSLVRASGWSNFHDVVAADPPVVAALPGAGWRAEFRDDDGSLDSVPLTAWLVYADGNIKPADVESSGEADDPTTVSNFVRLFHPSEEAQESKSTEAHPE